MTGEPKSKPTGAYSIGVVLLFFFLCAGVGSMVTVAAVVEADKLTPLKGCVNACMDTPDFYFDYVGDCFDRCVETERLRRATLNAELKK